MQPGKYWLIFEGKGLMDNPTVARPNDLITSKSGISGELMQIRLSGKGAIPLLDDPANVVSLNN